MLPLARVFAASAQAAAPLAELLAQHGYRIQVVNPDEQPAPGGDEPCELEISIEELPPAEAVERARYLAEQLGCDVLVASGALAGLRAMEAEPGALSAQPEVHTPAEVPADGVLGEKDASTPRPALWERLEPRLRSAREWMQRTAEVTVQGIVALAAAVRQRSAPALRSLAAQTQAGAQELGSLMAAAFSGLRRRYTAQRARAQAQRERAAATRPALVPRTAISTQSRSPRNPRERDWQMAVAGAAIMATIIMFALGMLSNSTQSSVPAVKVMAQPAAKIIGPAVVNARTLAPSAPAKSERVPTANAAKPHPSTAFALPTNDDTDEQDVVVRRFASPAPRPTHPQGRTVARVKQYSDIE